MKKNIIAIIIIILLFSTVVYANSFDNPKSMALGDAYLTKAYGFQALDWNPANLALVKHFVTINLIHANAQFTNNSVNLNLYNDKVGKYWNENDKEDILAKINNNGLELKLNAGASLPFISFSVWKLALQNSVGAYSSLKLDKEYFRRILYGVECETEYNFPDNDGEAISYAETKIGYGDEIPLNLIIPSVEGLPKIYGGISLGFIHGFQYGKIIDFHSKFSTTGGAVSFKDSIVAKTAGYNSEEEKLSIEDSKIAGNGFRINIGFYSEINENITAGITFNNLFGSIKWSEDCERRIFSVSGDSLLFLNEDFDDSLIVDTDTTYSIGSFKQNIPFEIHLGGSYNLKGFDLTLDYVQGFDESAFTSKKPKISFGVEYKPLQWLPLRLGFGFGEGKSSHFSFGSGFVLKNWEFNWAFRNYASPLSSYAKGFAFSIGSQLKF